MLKVMGEAEKKVRGLYEQYPFPHYRDKLSPTYIRGMLNTYTYLNILDKLANKKILNAGCGTGEESLFLASFFKPKFVCSVDLSYTSLDILTQEKKDRNLNNIFPIQSSINNLPFEQNSFDIIFCCGVLHHMKDPYGGFKKIVGLLKEEGIFILFVYDRWAQVITNVEKSFLNYLAKKERTDAYLKYLNWKYKKHRNNWTDITTFFADGYFHPQESTYRIEQILHWFSQNSLKLKTSFPPIKWKKFMEYISKRDKQGRYINASRTRKPIALMAEYFLKIFNPKGGAEYQDGTIQVNFIDRLVTELYLFYCGIFSHSQGVIFCAQKLSER